MLCILCVCFLFALQFCAWEPELFLAGYESGSVWYVVVVVIVVVVQLLRLLLLLLLLLLLSLLVCFSMMRDVRCHYGPPSHCRCCIYVSVCLCCLRLSSSFFSLLILFHFVSAGSVFCFLSASSPFTLLFLFSIGSMLLLGRGLCSLLGFVVLSFSSLMDVDVYISGTCLFLLVYVSVYVCVFCMYITREKNTRRDDGCRERGSRFRQGPPPFIFVCCFSLVLLFAFALCFFFLLLVASCLLLIFLFFFSFLFCSGSSSYHFLAIITCVATSVICPLVCFFLSLFLFLPPCFLFCFILHAKDSA